jgi:hypothetical protein
LFSELPKLFDRNFLVGYVIPAVLFLTATTILLNLYGLTYLTLWMTSTSDPLVGTAIAVVIAWFSAILLAALNRQVYQLMEGYGHRNPFSCWSRIRKEPQKQHFNTLTGEITGLLNKYKEHPDEFDQSCRDRLDDLRLKLAERFPDDVNFVLPTAFGNVIRAFEVYSRVMYGFEAIEGWNRLKTIIPDNYLQLIDAAKAETDLWMNIWLLSLIFIVEYVVFAGIARHVVSHFPILWVVPVALGIAWLACNWATHAAIEWGDLVKSSFDVYLSQLRSALGFKGEYTREQQNTFWDEFSRAIRYRLPERMDELYKIESMPKEQTSPLSNILEREKNKNTLFHKIREKIINS